MQEESDESSVRVLLLSLEHAASGTNLTAANHEFRLQDLPTKKKKKQNLSTHCLFYRFFLRGSTALSGALNTQKPTQNKENRRKKITSSLLNPPPPPKKKCPTGAFHGWTSPQVVFVHPMHAASAEKAVAYEAQAIARCRRYGQEKTVPVEKMGLEVWGKT